MIIVKLEGERKGERASKEALGKRLQLPYGSLRSVNLTKQEAGMVRQVLREMGNEGEVESEIWKPSKVKSAMFSVIPQWLTSGQLR